MAAMGHFDPFPPRRLNGRCPFSQPTSAGASGNGKDAPIAVIGLMASHGIRDLSRAPVTSAA